MRGRARANRLRALDNSSGVSREAEEEEGARPCCCWGEAAAAPVAALRPLRAGEREEEERAAWAWGLTLPPASDRPLPAGLLAADALIRRPRRGVPALNVEAGAATATAGGAAAEAEREGQEDEEGAAAEKGEEEGAGEKGFWSTGTGTA